MARCPSRSRSLLYWPYILLTFLLFLIWVFVYLVYCQLSGGSQVEPAVLVFVCLCCCALTCSSLLLLLAAVTIYILGTLRNCQNNRVDYQCDEHKYEEVGQDRHPELTSTSSTSSIGPGPAFPPSLPWRHFPIGSSLPLSLVVTTGSAGSSSGPLQSTDSETTYGFTQSGLKTTG